MEFHPLYLHVGSKTDVKLVGNQSNGELVYAWKEPVEGYSDSIVTCIGLVQYQNPKLVKFLTLFGNVNIVQASLSENRKYSAFIVHMSQVLDIHQNVECYGTYQAYLATNLSEPQDIVSCQTVTSSHTYFINCHFLHSLTQSGLPNSSITEQHVTEELLIVLIHRHSIQIHKFSEEPRNETLMYITESKVLSLEFLWCQWLPQHQCLFFLKYVDGMDFADRYIQDLSETVLCWVQFYNRNEYKLMMEISASCLNLFGKYTLQKQMTYINAVNKISECKFNLHVIASLQGDIYICCQCTPSEYIDMDEHSFSLPSRKSSNTSDITDSNSFHTASLSRSSSESTKSHTTDRESFYSTATKTLSINEHCFSENEDVALPTIDGENIYSETNDCHQDFVERQEVKYFREDSALYHVTVLHYCGRIAVFHDKSQDLKCDILYFFLVEGGNIIAWCPEQFAHLLDTRLCYGPDFCIVELNDDSKYLNDDMLKYREEFQTVQLPTGQCLLFVPGIACIFSVQISIEQLANELSSLRLSSPLSSLLNKNLDIFHYFSFHANNAETLFQLMKILLTNPYDLQITTVFKELLLGSALAAVEYDNHQKKHLSYYLTFFMLSSFAAKTKRNTVETTSLHQRRYIGECVIYKELSVVSIMISVNKTLPLQCSLWNNFCYQLKMEFTTRLGKTDYFHLFLKYVMTYNNSKDVQNKKKKSIIGRIQQFLICKKFQNLALEEAIESLSTSNCCSCMVSLQGETKIFDQLSMEMKKRFPQENHAAIHKIIESYKSHQEIQLYKITCLTFRLFGIRYDNETINYALLDFSREKMQCLFAMLQHLQLAAEHLQLSLPSRFHIVQAIVGFRCLNFNTFMQYVHQKLLILCNASVDYLLKDKDESEASIIKKQILICSLPREQAKPLLEKWDYHWNIKYHAKNFNNDAAI